MKKPTSNDSPADFTARGELRLIRLLPGPIERIWEYLVDPVKRARWFCGGELEQKAGGKVIFAMHHAKLSPDETPPDRYKHVQDPGVSFEGRVLRCEPPRLLVYTFGSPDSVVTFELTPEGQQVRLVLTHRAEGDELPELTNYASGWHTHFALLLALLEGTPPPPFWATHARLLADYDRIRAGS